MEYTEHPDYKQGLAEFQAAAIVAEKSNDEVGKLRAELDWTRKEQSIRGRIEAEQAAATRLEAVVAKVKEEFPNVPPAIYEAIKDPEQLLKVAEEMQSSIDGQVRKNVNSWGSNTGAPAGSSGGKKGRGKLRDESYMNDLVARVNRNEGGAQGAVKEFKDLVWRERVMPWHEAGKR